MTTGLYMLRVKELGLTLDELEAMSAGMFTDMYIERGNDGEEYDVVATQTDMDQF